MLILRQGATPVLKIGPFVDENDGKTPETGLSIGQADVRLAKAGGDMAQKNSTGAVVHDELGIYDCPLNATDTNTLGRLRLVVVKSGALPVFHDYMVMSSQVWNSLFSTDRLEVDVAELSVALEGALTLAQALRIILAALAGESDGGGTATIHFRDQADTKNRITATVDGDGNRTAISVDGS